MTWRLPTYADDKSYSGLYGPRCRCTRIALADMCVDLRKADKIFLEKINWSGEKIMCFDCHHRLLNDHKASINEFQRAFGIPL